MTREKYKEKVLNCSSARWNKSKREQTGQPVKYPQGYFKKKKCKVCGKDFIPKAPSELTCSEYCRKYSTTNNYYKRVYGISIEQYLDLAEKQHFKCAICGGDNFKMGEQHTGVLVVDHNHKTGEVRGLLCHNCNRALGLLHDSVENLMNSITYLKGVTTIPKGSSSKQSEAVSA